MTEPCHDIAHLAHVEMLTDRFDASLDFFTRVYGLKLSARDGDSAYLRAWDDYEFHTLKLTRSRHHRRRPHRLPRRLAGGAGAPGRRRSRPRATRSIGWTDGDLGHGRAFRFEDPFGHVFEIYWDTSWYEPQAGGRAAGAEEHRLRLHRRRARAGSTTSTCSPRT